MTETELQERELKLLIEDSVDASVERAFRRYGHTGGRGFSFRAVLLVLVLIAAAGVGWHWYEKNHASEPVAPVEDHDLTLENNGIFGFTVADFQDVVLEEGKRQKQMIVEEQQAYVNTTLTEAGFMNWGVFNKQQPITVHGTGEYTIDMSKIESNDIFLDTDTYELTINIPHAELHNVVFDPEKTEIGDTQNGWLAFGTIKMDAEQQKEFQVTAQQLLTEKLSTEDCLTEADRFAKLSAYETYQPIIKKISPAYKVVIDFQK